MMRSLPELPTTRDLLLTIGLLNRSFPGAGRWPMIDSPGELYAAVKEWLSAASGA
jgi:hypothetical protein